jgi:hypothetical protein
MDNSQAKRDSRQVAPGSNDGGAMNLTVGELAEIKEVVGRLHKKITELELNQKLEREKDRAELAAWAQTNLIQTQLLGKQTAVIEILTAQLKESERLNQQSETHSESLLAELQSLKHLLGNMPKSSPNVENLELKGLKSEILSLKEALTGMPQNLASIKQGQKNLETQQSKMDTKLANVERQTETEYKPSGMAGWNSEDWLWFAGKFAVGAITLFGLWMIWSNTNTIWQTVGYNYTKLGRIEKHLGVKK